MLTRTWKLPGRATRRLGRGWCPLRYVSHRSSADKKQRQEGNNTTEGSLGCSEKEQTHTKGTQQLGTTTTNAQSKSLVRYDASSRGKHSGGTQRNHSQHKSLWVPHIASTEHVEEQVIHMEGLFAGFKPLFLGKSSLPRSTVRFSYSTPIKAIEDDSYYLEPLVPWDMSISGVLKKDRHINRNIPKDVLRKLRPYHNINENVKNDDSMLKDELIKLKFHNSVVNDSLDVVNMFENYQNKPNSFQSAQDWKKYQDWQRKLKYQKSKYQMIWDKILYEHLPIKEDNVQIQSEIRDLERTLMKKFHNVTGLRSQRNETKPIIIPMQTYFQASICNHRKLKNLLLKTINNRLKPLLSTLAPHLGSKQDASNFEQDLLVTKLKLVNKLLVTIPCRDYNNPRPVFAVFTSVTYKSPVPGFKRMAWLYTKDRRKALGKKLIDKEYVYLDESKTSIPKRGSRAVHYPVHVSNVTIEQAFEDWRFD